MKYKKITVAIISLLICIGIFIVAIENFNNTQRYNDVGNIDYIHISFDDTQISFMNLTNNNYTSLYDEPFFKWLKQLNTAYGAKISLFVFNDVLTDVPDKFKTEFSQASDWLKIGLHSPDSGNNFKSYNYEQGKNEWNKFANNIQRITGSYSSIDRIPRLHGFTSSKDAQYGALGFLSSDDSRNSYYFSPLRTYYLYTNDYFVDDENGLLFLSTDFRVDWFLTNISLSYKYREPIKQTVYDELEFRYLNEEYANSISSYIVFGHENYLYDGNEISKTYANYFEDVCKFAKDNNLTFDFPQNRSYN